MSNNSKTVNFLLYSFIYSLLFTGVLRKWILPELSSALIIIPQVCAIIIVIFLQLKTRFSFLEKLLVAIGLCVFITSLVYGHENISVAMYGCLPHWFGLTLCSILGCIITKGDFIRISRILVICSIVNSILIIIQFNAPIVDIVNTANAISDDRITTMEISNLAGGFRPSGIFMHNSQSTLLQAITFPILLYNILVKRYLSLPLCIIAIALEIIAIPFSISRTNMMYHAGIALFFFLACYHSKIKKKIIIALPLVVILSIGFLSTSYGQKALNTMTKRVENASEVLYSGKSTSEGTLQDIYDRNIKYNIDALVNPRTIDDEEIPFWGFGQGMSTQVGAQILGISDNAGFSLAEWDGLRIMCESGFLFGWMIITIRIVYAFRYIFYVGSLRKRRNYLAIAILPAFILAFNLSTTWGNIIQANMAFLFGGMFMAAFKYKVSKKKNDYQHRVFWRPMPFT